MSNRQFCDYHEKNYVLGDCPACQSDRQWDEEEPLCSWCGGDGYFNGEDTPGFDHINDDPNETYDCPACRGSGLAKDQTLW